MAGCSYQSSYAIQLPHTVLCKSIFRTKDCFHHNDIIMLMYVQLINEANKVAIVPMQTSSGLAGWPPHNDIRLPLFSLLFYYPDEALSLLHINYCV